VMCRGGLSLRGMGSEITHTPFSLPIPNILCQTFRMRKLTATICLTIAVLVGSAGVISITHAETIWCKGLGIGCKSAEEIKKERLSCQKSANRNYNKFLIEALADPSLWMHAGDASAQDYAQRRRKQYFDICFNLGK
jgi:hypothetical protein